MAEPTSPFCKLRAFRAELYACRTRRADALVELADALLCAQAIPSVAHLSLEPVHRRGWPAPMPPWRAAASTPNGSAPCWPAARWTVACRSTRSMPPAGRAATPTAAPSAVCTTTPRGTRPASRSWPAGPTSGSPSSASLATAGPRRWTPAACTHSATTTRSPSPRSARCWTACPPAGRCRCSCSTPATTRPAWRWGWPMRPPRSWCGCVRGAASTPTATPGTLAQGRSATPPRRQAGHPQPGHLADTNPQPHRRRRPVRSRAGAGLGRAASQAAVACHQRDQAAPTDRARHPGPPAGRTRARQHPPTAGAVAVVARPRRSGPGDALAGLRAPLRLGTHHPLL
jgi:hypothetical protein